MRRKPKHQNHDNMIHINTTKFPNIYVPHICICTYVYIKQVLPTMRRKFFTYFPIPFYFLSMQVFAFLFSFDT